MLFVRFVIFVVISFFLLVTPAPAARRQPWNADGQYKRAFVVDTGLSALRRAPSPGSTCLRRLRLGRSLYIISSHRGANGVGYYYVAVTRRTRGYIDQAAVTSPARHGDDAHLMRLISNADGIDQIILCRLLSKHFPFSRFCPDALLAEGLAAEKVAQRLSRQTMRRPPRQFDPDVPAWRYWLNYSGLDRYSRLGLYFSIDKDSENFYYNGAAYKRILTRYPHSQAAATARERLQEIESKAGE